MYLDLFARRTESNFIIANRKIIKYCKKRIAIQSPDSTSQKIKELHLLLKMAKKNILQSVNARHQKTLNISKLIREINHYRLKNKI